MTAGKRLRVVLDTNVLLSGLGFRGETRRVWALVEDWRFDLFTSSFILDELRRNLAKKLRLEPAVADLLVEEVRLHAEMVYPDVTISAVKRRDADNRILECAVAAGADVLVTGNMKDLKPLGTFRAIRILTPREFLGEFFPA